LFVLEQTKFIWRQCSCRHQEGEHKERNQKSFVCILTTSQQKLHGKSFILFFYLFSLYQRKIFISFLMLTHNILIVFFSRSESHNNFVFYGWLIYRRLLTGRVAVFLLRNYY
jgi:hypothetical protein